MDNVVLTKEIASSRKQLLNKAFENSSICFPEIVNGEIVIKPNFLSHRNLLASTHPSTVEVVLSYIRKRYPDNEITIAEGSHVSDHYIQKYELVKMAKQHNAKVWDLNSDEAEWEKFTTFDLLGQAIQTRISKKVIGAGLLISLCVPKTHKNVGISLSLKNLVGCLHKEDRQHIHGINDRIPADVLKKRKRAVYDLDSSFGYISMKIRSMFPINMKHKGIIKEDFDVISRNLFALYSFMKPDICIVDGYTGMEGNGPWHGKKVSLNTVLISNNCYHADTIMSRIMGLDHSLLGYTKYLSLPSFDDELSIKGTTIEQCVCQFNRSHFTKELW